METMSLRLVRQVGDYGLSTKDEDCGRPGARRVCSHSPTFSEASHLEADLLEAGLLEGLCRCVLVSSTSLGFVNKRSQMRRAAMRIRNIGMLLNPSPCQFAAV